MPTQFEGHAKVSLQTQPYSIYNTSETYSGHQSSASLGSKNGDWAWFVNLNHTDSNGQPMVFATKLLTATGGAGTTPVTGPVVAPNPYGVNNYILGSSYQYHTLQDHAKIKLAYDVTPTLRASYTLGYWVNRSDGTPQTYLRDAAGNPVYYGSIRINGSNYSANGVFSATRDTSAHAMHGLSLKSHTQGVWDWELAASLYDYSKDQSRGATLSSAASTTASPTTTSLSGGNGTLTNQGGTGWSTLAAKGTWRPQGVKGAHIVDMGYALDSYQLHILKSNITGNWQTDDAGTTLSDVGGRTQTHALYAQDTWAFAPQWKTVLGARLENWSARGGYTRLLGSTPVDYADRNENYLSPKGALAFQATPNTVLKASIGRAVRMPTVQELYGATSNANLSFVNDPNLRPEKSVTTELSMEQDLGNGLLRVTVFDELVQDSLYTQLIPGSTNVSRVQNVDGIRTQGLELAYQGTDVVLRGLDLSGSITYADSRIVANDALPTSVGKYQPRVPMWRATALANFRWNEQLSTSLGVRYSGDQYGQLDNSDVNGFAYQGVSRYTVLDVRARYAMTRKAVIAFGIDNLTNAEYWNFHPYPKRTITAEMKYDF
jgi:iron complex outermembrane receptor protein